MDILERIEELRKARGWSVYKFADQCMITPSTLANMYARGTMPSISTLMLICQGCGITMSEFFAEKSELQTVEEAELLKNYRKLDDKNRSAIRQFIKNVS